MFFKLRKLLEYFIQTALCFFLKPLGLFQLLINENILHGEKFK